MKKIKMIFTGGTIGSTLNAGVIRPDGEKPRALLEAFREKYHVDFTEFADYDEPYTILSEHLDGAHLSKLIRAVACAISQGYRGIIITHGTDTLQYTAAALGYAFGIGSVPIVLVSSNYPIEDPRANGVENLYGAVCWLKDSFAGGVWVSYKNEGAPVQIHRGSRLLAHPQGSDRVESVSQNAGFYDAQWKFNFNADYTEKKDAILPLFPEKELTSPNILWIKPHPGMVYPALTEGVAGIIHETYHSGTLNLDEAGAFFRQAQELGIPVFVTGTAPGDIYESAADFQLYDLRLVPGRSAISVYMKLWLTLACGRNPADTVLPALGGDI